MKPNIAAFELFKVAIRFFCENIFGRKRREGAILGELDLTGGRNGIIL